MIEVKREDPALSSETGCFERCCFCRQPTGFWYTPKDVAVCLECAAEATPEDVPDKKVWCRREEIAASSDRIEEMLAFNQAGHLGSSYEVQ